MLSELYIENIAIIQKTSINFDQGFNVLTGETGAGKSILIGSINTILGERVSRDIVRTGCEKASVTAVFTDVSENVKSFLKDKDFSCEDGEALIISREISVDGRSSCRILGKPVSVSMLRDLGAMLINIHGQHDNQQLLSADKHMHFIDLFGDLEKYILNYQKSYNNLVNIQNKLDEIDIDQTEKLNRIDILTYQINEIEMANLSENEEQQLLAEQKMLLNSTKIMSALNDAHGALFGNDDDDENNAGAVELLDLAASNMEEVKDFLENTEKTVSRLREIYYETNEIANDISLILSKIDFDASRIDTVEERLDTIYRLKRKYGHSVSEVLTHLEQCKIDLSDIEMMDDRKIILEKELAIAKSETEKYADILTEKRIGAVKRFTKLVCDELRFLDMPNVVLTYSHEKTAFKISGQDSLYLLISTNLGEMPKPLSKIASGGELSRIMLSIKNVLANKDDVATLIFDEIDTGVSGRAAQRIGEKLRILSSGRQVLCVTHLAQIAAMADTHLLIEKNTSNGKTYTNVVGLDRNGRIGELARIIGGDNITPILLQNAEEMLVNSIK